MNYIGVTEGKLFIYPLGFGTWDQRIKLPKARREREKTMFIYRGIWGLTKKVVQLDN